MREIAIRRLAGGRLSMERRKIVEEEPCGG